MELCSRLPQTLLGGGVTAAPSSLIGAFTSAPCCARSSAILSVVGAAAGYAMGCSAAACPMVVCPLVTGSVGPEPKMALGSTSEAAMQSSTQELPQRNLNFTKKCSYFFLSYRLELLCDAVKTLRLARPAAAAGSSLLGCAYSTCVVGGS